MTFTEEDIAEILANLPMLAPRGLNDDWTEGWNAAAESIQGLVVELRARAAERSSRE